MSAPTTYKIHHTCTHLKLGKVGNADTVGGKSHVEWVSNVVCQVVNGRLASGMVLGNEADKCKHSLRL